MDEKPSARRGPDFCSLRYGLAVVMHLSNLSMITQRVSLSIAIIAMVNSTQQPAPANASADGPLQDPSGPSGEFHAGTSVYAWSPETQGLLFSSISYGILLTLIPSGYLAGIFGAKHMLGAGLLASSLLSLCTPLAADLGVSLVMVIRVAQGMAQGMAWTGQFTIWAKWAPPLERSKLTSIAGSGKGSHAGHSPVTGLPLPRLPLAASDGLDFKKTNSSPKSNTGRRLRRKETHEARHRKVHCERQEHLGGPAACPCEPSSRAFFKAHFWALHRQSSTYLAHPTISSVLHVSIRESGVLSSLPFLAASTCTVLGGQLADFLLSRDLLGLLTVRKLFSALGLLLPSLCAVALPFVASSYVTTVVLLILIPGTSNLCDSGFIINTLDIAPR
uniref:Solute carrier family 17 member 2 n=1 Tax=Myotis lucifugus TaxID=59463 RepID=G1PG66_MYOLU